MTWIVPQPFPGSSLAVLLIGEWWSFDCRVNNNKLNVTLWQRQNWKEPSDRERFVDGKHTRTIAKNMFQISNLTRDDAGEYYCSVCEMDKIVNEIEVKGNI